MKFPGKIHPKKNNEKYHDVEIPLLGIHTQGKNYKDSMNMAKDALGELLDIEIIIEKYGMDGEFIVTSHELKPLIARFLEIRRERAGMTIAEVVAKLGKKSLNYYSQYERGKSIPGFEKLREFISVIPTKIKDQILIG